MDNFRGKLLVNLARKNQQSSAFKKNIIASSPEVDSNLFEPLKTAGARKLYQGKLALVMI